MKTNRFYVSAAGLLCLSLSGLFTGCETNAKTGALTGAAAGAMVGIMTNKDDDVLRKAVIGAGIGAAAGAIIKARRYRETGGTEQGRAYPTASRTSDPNLVHSPYGGHVVDVAGFRSGELAIDPKTNQVFRVP